MSEQEETALIERLTKRARELRTDKPWGGRCHVCHGPEGEPHYPGFWCADFCDALSALMGGAQRRVGSGAGGAVMEEQKCICRLFDAARWDCPIHGAAPETQCDCNAALHLEPGHRPGCAATLAARLLAQEEADKPAREGLAALVEQWRETAAYEAENANLQYAQGMDACADALAAWLRGGGKEHE